MSDSIFSSSLVINVPKIELEAMDISCFDWNLERFRLKSGEVYATIDGAQTPQLQIGRIRYSNGLLFRGDYPKNSVLLVFVKNSQQSLYRNRPLEPNEIIVSAPNAEIDFIMPTADDIYTIAVAQSLFESHLAEHFGENSLTSIYKTERLRIREEDAHTFSAFLDHWVYHLKHTLMTKSGIAPDRVETILLQELFERFEPAISKEERKKFDIAKIREQLENSLCDPVSIDVIAREAGIGKRRLFIAFKERYGMSPKKYLQTLRLNAARKELLENTPQQTTVSDIALKYTFLHQGHFTSEYKKMFSETPSQTLKK